MLRWRCKRHTCDVPATSESREETQLCVRHLLSHRHVACASRRFPGIPILKKLRELSVFQMDESLRDVAQGFRFSGQLEPSACARTTSRSTQLWTVALLEDSSAQDSCRDRPDTHHTKMMKTISTKCQDVRFAFSSVALRLSNGFPVSHRRVHAPWTKGAVGTARRRGRNCGRICQHH